jgi:4-amino-4-deoxy-L-arabinose transferase-like glycosyltransferase
MKKLLNGNKLAIILVIVLAAFLRLRLLGSYPALNADEAAIGYNAYSLLKTGMDEHGNSWPIHFQSFNDFKPGLYFYIVLPFVKFMGLDVWAVRLPGALFGIATVYIVYRLALELFESKHRQIIALTSAFFLAISPWHIHFSRGGWEVNVATFFIIFGVLCFLKALRSGKFLHFSFFALSFALSLYTYHAARVVAPLMGVGLIAIYGKSVYKKIKPFIISLIIVLIVCLPLAFDLFQGNLLSRAAGVGLFADTGPFARINEQRGEHGNFTGLTAKLFHNKAVNYGLAFIENWSEHFHGEFLFLSGDVIERNRVPETGQMYLHDLLFIIAGLVGFALTLKGAVPKGASENKGILLILWWLLVAPIAAALTFQSPHALRAQNMVIPLTIISAYGLVALSFWLHTIIRYKKLLDAAFLIFVIFVAWGFTRYLHMYWVHMSKEYPYSSQYGVKELVQYTKVHGNKFDQIIITDKYDQPYILFLFYMEYPPEKFQSSHNLTDRDNFGFSTVRSFDKFRFEPIKWDTHRDMRNVLLVGVPGDFPPGANVTEKIYFPNGEPAFEIVPL